MPPSRPEPREITLSGFTFANQLPSNRPDAEDDDVPEYTQTSYRSELGSKRQESYDRMVTDNLGQELASEASIWKIYREEADEHDQELVRGQHANLDVMLLFAALFSAVLTAFLIESKDLLQQDSADVSAALLLYIAQSQYRMELGSSGSAAQPSEPTLPDFSPSRSARWINGMWFAALGISLSTALIAMLSKEWLTAFLASRPRSAHDHALLRQARLEGLERWWALHIVALLPSMLHASLLLFAVGLVLYLWTLDSAISGVIAALVAVTVIFYLATAILGAVYEFCPYVTQFSKYIRRAWLLLFANSPLDENGGTRYSVLKDLQALLWLTHNARDPTVVECSYQAMAGLQYPTDTDLKRKVKHSASYDLSTLPIKLNEEVTLFSLLGTLLGRYEQITSRLSESSESSEMAAARYLAAITALFAHTQSAPQDVTQTSQIDPYVNGQSINQLDQKAQSEVSIAQLLYTTESIWSENGPSLTANTYASVLVSASDVLLLAASILSARLADFRPELAGNKRERDNTYAITIDQHNPFSTSPSDDLTNLQAYYSRWLARASTIIGLFAHRRISGDLWLFRGLLEATANLASCEVLNPPDLTSTHHAQYSSPDQNSPGYRFVVPTNIGRPFNFQPNHLRNGPLGRIMDLLKENLTNKARMSICLAGVYAYGALAPVILQQELRIDRNELTEMFNLDTWQQAPTASIFGLRFITVRLALLTIRSFGISRTSCRTHYELLKIITEVLETCFEADKDSAPNRQNSHLALAHHNNDLVPLLEFISEYEGGLSLLHPTVKSSLLKLVQVPFTNSGMTACDNLLTPNAFLALVSMLTSKRVKFTPTAALFQNMVRRMRMTQSSERPQRIPWNNVPAVAYMHPFTQTARGLTLLSSVAQRTSQVKAATGMIIDIVHLAAGRDPCLTVERIELASDAIPGFCHAVDVVIQQRKTQSREKKIQLLSFFDDVLEITKVALKNTPSSDTLRNHQMFKDIWSILKTIWGTERAREIKDKYLSAKTDLGITIEEPKTENQQPEKKHGKAVNPKEKINKQVESKKPTLMNPVVSSSIITSRSARTSGAKSHTKATEPQHNPSSSVDGLDTPGESSVSDLELSEDSEAEENGVDESEIEGSAATKSEDHLET